MDSYCKKEHHPPQYHEEHYEPQPCEPTGHPPGSLKKLDEMLYRASKGQDIFSADDATNENRIGGRLCRADT